MEILGFYEVNTLRGALRMRKVRNECREFMTRDKGKISIWQQIKWFYNFYLPQYRRGETVAYIGNAFGRTLCYGMIRDRKTKPLLSGGVSSKFRGVGVGRVLFTELVKEASTMQREGDRAVFLEVLENNYVARRLYTSLGFVEKSRANGVVQMQKDYGEFD